MGEHRRILGTAAAAAILVFSALAEPCYSVETLLPRHVTPEMRTAVKRGLDWLAKNQLSNGSWASARDGAAYPISMTALAGMAFLANGNTQVRGPYADQVRGAMDYLMRFGQSNGLITGAGQEQGRPMYGHGFSLMFLSCCYATENRQRERSQLKKLITAAVRLTAEAQSGAGGWTYNPGGGDEGSVTITQIQALRSAHNAGFTVPEGTIKSAIRYLELCRTPEGGIRYSLGSGGGARLAISAAAVATLYNAGDYDSDMAEQCLEYVHGQFQAQSGDWSRGGGHAYYAHLYASQAFYQAGDEYWEEYFPPAAKQLLGLQKKDGFWEGDGIGPVYGTSIALIVLQLPYKFLPIYQR
jgi:hypothetical protein